MTAYGIGLLGCGRISENHLRGYRHAAALDGVGEIVALCDANPAVLEQQATKHEVATQYGRLEDLAADPRVDVVTVLTPPDVRCQVVVPLLEAGKHVLVEKPFAHTLEEAREMVDAAAANHRLLAVNQNYRWRADTLKLKELIDSGAIGRVVGIHQLHAMWRDEGPGWRRTTDYLALAVMAVHWLDRFRWLTGDEGATVYAATRSTGLLQSKGEDWAAVTVTFQHGTIAQLTEDWCSASRHHADSLLIDATEGSLVAKGTTITRYGRRQGDEQQYEAAGAFPSTFAHSMRLLLQAIAEGGEPSISGRDNLGTMALLDGAYRSAATGDVIRLEPNGIGARSNGEALPPTGAQHPLAAAGGAHVAH
ncbi:MAG: Gfo/Idh/MocA family oxidoreductase [Chloroflexi bacterium]|nr:Gfo/Idh/MocA family oxidoreductase [Chloroflexota bacterium]